MITASTDQRKTCDGWPALVSRADVRNGRQAHFSFHPLSEPPSAPQNLTGSVVDQNTVMLTWTGPKFLGGRNDTVYRIECDVCDPATSFVPAREGLNETQVVVTGLSPTTAYRFLVYAENGASGHDASQFSDISFTTDAASSPPRPSPPSSPSSSTNGMCKYLPGCVMHHLPFPDFRLPQDSRHR